VSRARHLRSRSPRPRFPICHRLLENEGGAGLGAEKLLRIRSRPHRAVVHCQSRLVGAAAAGRRRNAPPRPSEGCKEKRMTVRLLLLGGTGQVGSEFLSLDRPRDVVVVAPDPDELDLARPDAIADAIAAGPWHAVVNAAAYTNVDRAESERDLAFAINAHAARILAGEPARRGIPLIHISTDYV